MANPIEVLTQINPDFDEVQALQHGGYYWTLTVKDGIKVQEFWSLNKRNLLMFADDLARDYGVQFSDYITNDGGY